MNDCRCPAINTTFANSVQNATSLHATLTKSLPVNGWIKPCIICSAPTSKCYYIFEDLELYNCYFCKDCLKHEQHLGNSQFGFIVNKEIRLQKRLRSKYEIRK